MVKVISEYCPAGKTFHKIPVCVPDRVLCPVRWLDESGFLMRAPFRG